MRGRTLTQTKGNHAKPAVGPSSLAVAPAEGSARFAPDSWRIPLLGDLLNGIHLRSSVLFRPEFGAPWGVSIDRSKTLRRGIPDHATVFHIVADGSCWLHVSGVRTPVVMSEGDFAILTRGTPHILRDKPETPAINFFDLVKRCAPGKDGVFRAGGEGPTTKFVCGGMQFEDPGTHPLLAILPPLLYVKATEQAASPCLRMTIRHILTELDSDDAGAPEVVTRLADILFILAVRSYFEQNADTAEFGWLAAVRDQRVGPALGLLHGQPDKPWTIESLSRHVAMSRSAFADRFTMLVGEPPFRYLTRVRINAAARRMRMSDDGLGAVAAAAGYESLAAFTRAFRRHLGMTPGMYRKCTRTGGPV